MNGVTKSLEVLSLDDAAAGAPPLLGNGRQIPHHSHPQVAANPPPGSQPQPQPPSPSASAVAGSQSQVVPVAGAPSSYDGVKAFCRQYNLVLWERCHTSSGRTRCKLYVARKLNGDPRLFDAANGKNPAGAREKAAISLLRKLRRVDFDNAFGGN
ncbi:hypothetical protein TWF281_004850 [Arthrobotrys megalospora]